MKPVTAVTMAREAARKAAEDLAQRQRATTILTPEALTGRGKKATAASRLQTALGGQIRPITLEDLRAFKQAVQKLQAERKHAGGIFVSEVLAHSSKDDQYRCKTEIHYATPYRIAAGVMGFQVQASGKHGAARHTVQIELMGWHQAVGSPAAPMTAAKVASDQPVRFDCSCARHRYWLRYIATIGGWNIGRPETGFPKIRNPQLKGVACKHVLRVAVELSGSVIRGQIAAAIRQERQRLAGKTRKAVLNVERHRASEILERQQAKPRDVERMAKKMHALLVGKAPTFARKPLTAKGIEQEAAAARARMLSLGMSAQQANRVAAAIMSAAVGARP
jgi:hypothetical protein